MRFLEKELRFMFEGRMAHKEPVFAGNMLIAKLDEDLRVKICFNQEFCTGEYTGFEVQIINRINGIVDGHCFSFSEIMGDLTLALGQAEYSLYPVIIPMPDGTEQWRVPEPSDADKKEMAEAILKYVNIFER